MVKSIFLAGPSPRNSQQFDWRKDAIKYLQNLNFDGTVFIPIPKDKFYGNSNDSLSWTYTNQIKWECTARQISDLILFWIPREIDITKNDLGMPGFTTNIEFGEDLHSGKILYGRPDSAVKCKYLDERYKEIKQKIYNDLFLIISETINILGDGSLRVDGEIFIPLFIWNTLQFKKWYSSLRLNGNHIKEAKILHHFKISNNFVFSYIIWASIWIEKEQRYKSNEFIFSRTDISSVMAYYKNSISTKIILVKEFRSPVNNISGFVYELPGGSSTDININPQINAQHEIKEEIGIIIDDISRFKYIGERQLMSTLSSHKASLYSIELNSNEFNLLTSYFETNTAFGVIEDSEKTFIEIIDIKDIFKYNLYYSMLGMIFESLQF